MPPAAALTFGLVLGAAGVGVLALEVHWLAAVWAVAGFLCYVLVYTVWLKRRTPQNIVIGGARAVPPLVAWAAVDGSVSATAVALFAIVFLWTPPHFWALALLLDEDYARAGVPMLPSVRGSKASAQQILVYTVLLVAASLVPVALGTLGWVYAAAAVVLGGRFIWLALRLLRAPDDRAAARRTFLYSLLYLALLFVAMGVDSAAFSDGPVAASSSGGAALEHGDHARGLLAHRDRRHGRLVAEQRIAARVAGAGVPQLPRDVRLVVDHERRREVDRGRAHLVADVDEAVDRELVGAAHAERAQIGVGQLDLVVPVERPGQHDRQRDVRVVERLQPQEDRVGAPLEDREPLEVREPGHAVGEAQGGPVLDLEAPEAGRAVARHTEIAIGSRRQGLRTISGGSAISPGVGSDPT